MKKSILVLLLIAFLVLPVIVEATEVVTAPGIGLLAALEVIINVLFTLLVAVAVIFIIFGAFELLQAGGDPEKIGAGRAKILYAAIAVIVALLARGIIAFVRGMFPPGT